MECPICGSVEVKEAEIFTDEELLQVSGYKFICQECNYEWE